jgi:hypothetical protein
MKHVSFLIFLLSVAFSNASESVKVTGSTDYLQKEQKSLITNANAEYRVKIYEHPSKQWVGYLGGKVVFDYDHFGNELRTSAFTTLGIDF